MRIARVCLEGWLQSSNSQTCPVALTWLYGVSAICGYPTYTKLFESGVAPILDYCSSVWGYNILDKIDTIKNRAIRLFLGVHRFAANKTINADMGWISCLTRRHVNMLRLWNKLITMDDCRLVKNIFNLDKQLKRGWSKNLYDVFRSLNCEEFSLKIISLIWILFAQSYTICIVTIGRIPLHVKNNYPVQRRVPSRSLRWIPLLFLMLAV